MEELHNLPLDEFLNHAETILAARRDLYSVDYVLEVAAEAKRRKFATTEGRLLSAAADRMLAKRTEKPPAAE